MRYIRLIPQLLGVMALLAAALVVVAPPSGAATATSSLTVWLCQPGVSPDPCAGNLSYSVVPAAGATKVVHAHSASAPPIDCFYVYPTVSAEDTPNSDLAIQPVEIGAARGQIAPLSQDCRVYAPMYRQLTVPCLGSLQGAGTICAAKNVADVIQTLTIAYNSVLQGFESFLADIPKHEHFVLMGHSQGAALLIELIKNVVDPNPALRSRLVSAILLGGNLTVPAGKLVGGAFAHIPLCTTAREDHCAIAYSSFYSQPPANSFFGIPGTGVSFMWLDLKASPGLQVACVAPNQLLGQSWTSPRFPNSTGSPPYVSYPHLYQAQCQDTDGVSFLHVSVPANPGNARPTVTASLGPAWGLHLDDPNLTLGNLIAVVAQETKTAVKS